MIPMRAIHPTSFPALLRIAAVLFIAMCPATTFAQLQVPVSLELNGPTDQDRQVVGLAAPEVLDAAINVESIRTNATTFATVQGTSTLTGTLVPAPLQYTTGMVVSIVPVNANHANVQLDLNGLGAVPVVKGGGVPLDSADLWPGEPARMVFDGARFILISAVPIPCRQGYHVGSREFCIEDSSREAVTWYEAVTFCEGMNARLCKYSEWSYACLKDPAFIGTVLNYEWIDDAANDADNAKRVGNGGNGETGTVPGIDCRHGASTVPTSLMRFRCCASR